MITQKLRFGQASRSSAGRGREIRRVALDEAAELFEYEGDLDEHSDAIVKLRTEIVEAVRAGDVRRGPPKKKRIIRKKRI